MPKTRLLCAKGPAIPARPTQHPGLSFSGLWQPVNSNLGRFKFHLKMMHQSSSVSARSAANSNDWVSRAHTKLWILTQQVVRVPCFFRSCPTVVFREAAFLVLLSHLLFQSLSSEFKYYLRKSSGTATTSQGVARVRKMTSVARQCQKDEDDLPISMVYFF